MSETLVQKLMKRACITLDENSSIKNLIDTLNKNKVGCVVVLSSNANIPILSLEFFRMWCINSRIIEDLPMPAPEVNVTNSPVLMPYVFSFMALQG